MTLRIVNFHIPKTAGSSFSFRFFRSLRQVDAHGAFHNVTHRATKLEGEHVARHREAFQLEEGESSNDALKVFTGHYRYRDVADLITAWKEDALLVTFLRDPVERVLSDYFYSISERHDDAKRFIQRYPTLERFLDVPENVNKQADFLAPDENATAPEITEHLQETFGFIGCTKRFDADFARLMTGLFFPVSDPVVRNETPFPEEKRKAHSKHRDLIHDLTAKDRAIYDAFCASGTSKPLRLPSAFEKTQAARKETLLVKQIADLAPWHHRIHVTGDTWTGAEPGADQTGAKVALLDPSVSMQNQIRDVLPNGFEGRSFLDCGCNGGGYCFAAKDLGASRALGVDVRQHWLRQADFVLQNRDASNSGIEFRQADLMYLDSIDEEFDVTWFSGVFYHLPDPITGLKNAADRTKELIFVNTAVTATEPGVEETPALHMKIEGTEQLMSGVHTLSWYPSGPRIIEGALNWMGFVETRLLFWFRKVEVGNRRTTGRLCVVGARKSGRLSNVNNATPRRVFARQ